MSDPYQGLYDIPLLSEAIRQGLYRVKRKKALDGLGAGLELNVIQSVLRSISFPLDQDIIDFFGWVNGVREGSRDTLEDLSLLWGYHVVDLIGVVDALRDEWAELGYVPLFEDEGGGFIVADHSGRILLHDLEEGYDEDPVLFVSLRAMLTTLFSAYHHDLVLLDRKKDGKGWLEVCIERNPDILFWKEQLEACDVGR